MQSSSSGDKPYTKQLMKFVMPTYAEFTPEKVEAIHRVLKECSEARFNVVEKMINAFKYGFIIDLNNTPASRIEETIKNKNHSEESISFLWNKTVLNLLRAGF